MDLRFVLLPLFIQVLLTLCLLFWTARERFAAAGRGEVDVEVFRTTGGGMPPRATWVGRAYDNQFQLPLLFYVLTILAIFLHKTDFLFQILSWVFVLTRIAHALVYGTSNNLRLRFRWFLVGGLLLTLMWVIFIARVLVAL
jgi:hypothetical protein